MGMDPHVRHILAVIAVFLAGLLTAVLLKLYLPDLSNYL